MIQVEIDDKQVMAALNRLLETGADMTPAMRDIGEYLVTSTRQRFQDGVAPDGTPWAPNSATTFDLLIGGLGKSNFGKSGRLNKRGAGRVAGKKPLIGETKQLSTKIFPRATAHSVEVGSPLEYAATQQFGAKKHSFTGGKTPWGDIPARPFLGLSDDDQRAVLDILQEHLEGALG
jgi:phage virion morphogenesis protein